MAVKELEDYIDNGSIENFIQPGPSYFFEKEGTPWEYADLIPGHFYTFQQLRTRGNDDLPSLDDWTAGLTNVKPYFDNRPVFLALDQYGLGLNVKLIHQPKRRSFIRNYCSFIRSILSNLLDDNGSLIKLENRIRKPEIRPLLSINHSTIKTVFLSQLSDRKFDFLIDKYKRDEMRNPKLIDWPHVPKIGEINYSADPMIATRSVLFDYL